MIFVISLPALLVNVRYKWLANGTLGSEEFSGITQVGSFFAFRISSTPPLNAEELFIYDATDASNYTVANYAHLPGAVTIDTAAIADAMWDALLADHDDAGSAGEALAGLVLSVGAINPTTVTIVSPVSQSGNKITARAADSWSFQINGLGNITTRAKLWFAINDPGDDDTEAKVFIEETDGLTVVNGDDEFASPEQGSITVDDATAGDITVDIDEIVTSFLSGSSSWVVKMLAAGTAITLATGHFNVTKAGIEAIT